MLRSAVLRSPDRSRQLWRQLMRIAFLFVVGFAAPLCFFYSRVGSDTFYDGPRPGEAFISNEEFLRCLMDRLSHKADDPGRIPYVLLPVTMDYHDIKQFFCNVTAPITYIMFINNGQFKPVSLLLQRVAAELSAYVGRNLFIVHHPENTGYASAVNEGLRHAFSFSIAQVPWVLVTNADVRFAPPLIPTFVANIHKNTRDQETRIRLLREEVANEPHTLPANADRRFAFRSSTYPVITAPALPYRIRTMPLDEMRRQFDDTVGIFYTDSKEFMATFALPRLTVEAVGYFDENYYPAYGEDHDYVWRMHALGFRYYTSKPGQFVHFENANVNFDREALSHGVYKYTAYFLQSTKFVRMRHQPFRLHYRRSKWFKDGVELKTPAEVRNPLPFKGAVPVDLWVLDAARRRSIWEIGESLLCRDGYQLYNMSLLEFPTPV